MDAGRQGHEPVRPGTCAIPGATEIPPPPGILGAEYGRAQAPTAPPGRYVARLSVGGKDYQQPFEIKRDPRIVATDEDLRAQFDLLVQIRERTNQITEAVGRLRKARQGDAATRSWRRSRAH